MPDLQFCVLPEMSKPLLSKFYRAHNSPMRATNGAQLWVAKQPDIVAALCLTAVANGHWLTGLFIAPAHREQGIASELIRQTLAQTSGPIWLFCHPDLLDFYRRAGFEAAAALPESLADRFARYSASKPLIAMSSLGYRI